MWEAYLLVTCIHLGDIFMLIISVDDFISLLLYYYKVLKIKIKWQKIQVWNNNNKRTIWFQIWNIDSSCTINAQLQNIDLNLNSSLIGQKRAKNKSISIDKFEEFFAAFRNVIRYRYWELNHIISLSEKNLVY